MTARKHIRQKAQLSHLSGQVTFKPCENGRYPCCFVVYVVQSVGAPIRQADYAEERLDAHHEFQEELDEALRIRKMVETGLHDMALERLMASTEARAHFRYIFSPNTLLCNDLLRECRKRGYFLMFGTSTDNSTGNTYLRVEKLLLPVAVPRYSPLGTGSNVPPLPQAPLPAGADRGVVLRSPFGEATMETCRQEN